MWDTSLNLIRINWSGVVFMLLTKEYTKLQYCDKKQQKNGEKQVVKSQHEWGAERLFT